MNKAEILLVDDDTLFLFLTEKVLEKEQGQFSIKSIDNVKEALSYLEACKRGEHLFPDGIFVDLNMPEMSGMDFAGFYNHHYAPHYPQVKLVMLTSSISRKEKEKAMNIPAVHDFIQKPLTKEKLTELL